MDFNIVLFEGTDSIKFGMTSKEIQQVLGKVPKLFRKSEFDRDMTEDYPDVCHVYYDGDSCVAFEFYEPSRVFFNGESILGKTQEDAKNLFSRLSGYSDDSGAGFSAYDGDFSCCLETVGDNEYETVAAVWISRKGYFAEQSVYLAKCYADKYS